MRRRHYQHVEPYVVACWRLSPTRSGIPMSPLYICVSNVIYSHRKWDISSPQVSILSLSLSLAHYWFSLFYSLLFSSSPNKGHEDGGYDNGFVMNNNNKKKGWTVMKNIVSVRFQLGWSRWSNFFINGRRLRQCCWCGQWEEVTLLLMS
jgi:hypothetical protein